REDGPMTGVLGQANGALTRALIALEESDGFEFDFVTKPKWCANERPTELAVSHPVGALAADDVSTAGYDHASTRLLRVTVGTGARVASVIPSCAVDIILLQMFDFYIELFK
ncbi:hypothetical protein PENTCL1PPCAC_418, partial [Pristionchus entomophagus]